MKNSVVKDAKLVMESRGFAPKLRSISFSGTWSKLYKTDEHILDMSCYASENGLRVQGQLLDHKGWDIMEEGQVVLKDTSAGMIWAEIGVTGDFSFEVDAPGKYQLEAVFGDTTVRISNLMIS